MPSGVDQRQARALRRVLQQMPKETTEGIRRAVRMGAEELSDEMRDRYSQIRRTGNLERQVGFNIRSNGFVANVGFPGKRRRKKAYYARFIEDGTRFIPPNPVLRDSLLAKKQKIADMFDREIDKALEIFTRG